MNNLRKNRKSHAGKGFAAMDPEKRIAIAKKGGHAPRKDRESEATEISSVQRGFAAMDTETRKKIASKGGRAARRNRVDWKNQVIIL